MPTLRYPCKDDEINAHAGYLLASLSSLPGGILFCWLIEAFITERTVICPWCAPGGPHSNDSLSTLAQRGAEPLQTTLNLSLLQRNCNRSGYRSKRVKNMGDNLFLWSLSNWVPRGRKDGCSRDRSGLNSQLRYGWNLGKSFAACPICRTGIMLPVPQARLINIGGALWYCTDGIIEVPLMAPVFSPPYFTQLWKV